MRKLSDILRRNNQFRLPINQFAFVEFVICRKIQKAMPAIIENDHLAFTLPLAIDSLVDRKSEAMCRFGGCYYALSLSKNLCCFKDLGLRISYGTHYPFVY